MPGPQIITPAELAKHRTPDDMWLAVDGDVYDVTDFKDMHPGGQLTPRPCSLARTLPCLSSPPHSHTETPVALRPSGQ